jgi:hypothetical protein
VKKIHKNKLVSLLYGSRVLPVCRVDNKTYAYTARSRWNLVTCKRCLAKREHGGKP